MTLASNLGPWTLTLTTIHDAQGTALGVYLGDQIDMLDFLPLESGDSVTIDVFRDGFIHQITGRASKARTACFRKTDLTAIGIGLHDPVYVSVQKVNGVAPRMRPNPYE